MGFLDFFKRRRAPQKRRFAAARLDRLTAGWLTTSASINDELKGDLDALRMRAREMANNNALGRRFIKLVARNVVGSQGVLLQSRVINPDGTPDSLANNAIEAAWHQWGRRGSAEISGRMSFTDLQRAIMQTVARDGEALVGIVRGAAAANPEGLALQLLDTTRLDTRKQQSPGKGQNAILMGVEIDAYTRPVAYWLRESAAAADSRRVPAADLIHIFLPENPEQARGLPWMHASMLAMHDLGEFTRSAMLNARRSADVLGYLVSPDGTGTAIADDTDAQGMPVKLNAPGTYDVLPEGYDIRTPEYNYPNTVFEPFTKAIKRDAAIGLDVAAHNLTGDMSDVNYSSARIAELEERDQWMSLQQWFIDAFVEPVFGLWFPRAMTANAITMPNDSPLPVAKAEKFRVHEWQPRRWTWVDPMKDIEAARLAIKSGVASPQMIAAQNGVDIEDVLDAIAAFERMTAAKGVTMVDYDHAPAQPPETAAPTQESPADKALVALAARAAERGDTQPPQVFNIHPHVTLNQAEVRVDVQPQDIRVEQPAIHNTIQVEPTPIHIAPPEIRNIIEVEPTPITMEARIETPAPEVTVNLPARRTETTIERDAAGNIARASQIETDA